MLGIFEFGNSFAHAKKGFLGQIGQIVTIGTEVIKSQVNLVLKASYEFFHRLVIFILGQSYEFGEFDFFVIFQVKHIDNPYKNRIAESGEKTLTEVNRKEE